MQLTTSNPTITFSFAWLTLGLSAVLDRLPVVGYRRLEARRVDWLMRQLKGE